MSELSSRRKEELSSAGSGLCAWNKPSSTSAGRCVRFGGLTANCQVVTAWRWIVESCLWAGACWQKEEEEGWLSQCKDYRLECFRRKWCLFQDEDRAKKDLTVFLERGWSLTLVAQSWLVHASVYCELTKGERRLEPMWAYQMFHCCPLQRAESCSSPPHRQPDTKALNEWQNQGVLYNLIPSVEAGTIHEQGQLYRTTL